MLDASLVLVLAQLMRFMRLRCHHLQSHLLYLLLSLVQMSQESTGGGKKAKNGRDLCLNCPPKSIIPSHLPSPHVGK